jgi:O-antigen/teichoic acid export membrane protein
MFTQMKNLLASLSLGRTPDARLNLSVAIGSTVMRQVAASALYFVAMWMTTRQLGPHYNGVLATVMLLPQTLYAFLNLGLGASHVYHLSSGSGNHNVMRRTNWMLALGLWSAVVAVLAASSEQQIGKYLPGIDKTSALYASVLFPLMLLGGWTSSLLQGNRDYQTYNRTLLIQPFVFCASVLACTALNAISVISVLSCSVISQMSLWLLSESKIRKISTPVGNGQHTFADAVKFGLRSHVSNIITFMNYRIALYLVSLTLGATAAGEYALSIQLAEALWLISSAASMIIFPESAAHSKSPAELNKMIRKVAGSVLRITFAGALVAAAVFPFLIPWAFGAAYRGSVVPLLILLPGIVAWSYMSVLSNSLAGMGSQNVNIQSALLCLSINIGGNLLLISRFGAAGAALASSVAFASTALYTVFRYRRIMRAKLAAAA